MGWSKDFFFLKVQWSLQAVSVPSGGLGLSLNANTTKKSDSENDNDKVNMPSFPSPEPSVSYFDDLDYLKDFENEFPVIVYNDALTSKSDFLTEPSINPQHIDEFNSKDETSFSECDEEEQNVLYINDLFPFNVEGYTEEIMHDFEQRLEIVFGRPVNQGQELFTSHAWSRLFEIKGPLVREFMLEFFSTCKMSDAELGLDEADTLCFQLGGARRSTRAIPNNRDLRDYWIEVSSDRDFLEAAPSYVYIRDPMRRLCHRMVSYNIFGRGQALEKVTATDLIYLRSMDQVTINVRYLLAQYLFRHAEGRKIGARMLGGHFIGRLAAHFGLVSDEGLMGLTVITREPPMIDMDELVKLNICVKVGDTLAWVASGPERQQVVTVGAPKVAKDALVVDEGAPAIPAPVQAPQPPLAASPTKNLP
ncbi:hypothetical protein Tco_0802049 [Tanacetum coccineum]|uniref:Uncharacterized protein n=1 Tax=Tanacetum coccineum TaxID=301880 RepID=A0ABQ5A014_9ASTR